MEIFSAISGVTSVNYHGQQVNIIEFVIGDSTVGAIFWCIFITAVGLTCIFTIVGLVKNMVANNRTVSTIVGKGEQHKIIDGNFQCLRGGLGQRLFRVEYGCDIFICK